MFENVRKILKFERSASGSKGHKYKKITKSTVIQKVVVRKTLYGNGTLCWCMFPKRKSE